jgi:fumarate hydratase subunit beta
MHQERFRERYLHMENINRKNISLPLNPEDIKTLNAGDAVYLTGFIYTARDAAHKKIVGKLNNGEFPGFELKGATIYYAGPCPAKPGEIIGSAGPTTSGRMDRYAPLLLDNGLLGMIGKGERSSEVIESIKKNKAVYFGATGGAGALIAQCVKSAEIVAFDELGTEAVRKLYVENMPVVVLIDSNGNNAYSIGRAKFATMNP